MEIKEIGKVKQSKEGTYLEVLPEYQDGLIGLEDFSHLYVLYLFHHLDIPELRGTTVSKPYTNGPEELGTFATRGPVRPNPIALSAAKIIKIQGNKVYLEYLDAEDDSPILDIKPYTASSDVLETFKGPDWCAHWPQSFESSGSFDWGAEFNFPE